MLKKSKTVGCLEYVDFPDLGTGNLLVKVDTGAFSGALHCSDIKVVLKDHGSRRVLRFTPLGRSDLTQETEDFEKTYIRSATGHRVKRYVITTRLTLKGKTYMTKIGLSDRKDMKREALLGRRFLRENNILVDVQINQELDDEGKNTR